MDWVYKALVEGEFDETTAEIACWSDFEQSFTLHDSYWIGLIVDILNGSGIFCAFDFDTFWQGDRIKNLFSEKRAVLVIKFPELMAVEFEEFSGDPEPNSPVGGTTLLADKTLVIDNIYGGKTRLKPVDEIGVWLFDENREQFQLFPKN